MQVQILPRSSFHFMKNYKATDSKMRCKNFQFEIGKRYSIPEDKALKPCSVGFHSCDTLWQVTEFYPLCNSRFFEVEVEDTIKTEDKNVSRHITILRELTFYEVMRMLNKKEDGSNFDDKEENTNSGFLNKGSYNRGNHNKGSYNTGNDNIGSYNVGNWNIGNSNIGNYNTGNYNKGNYNVGNYNKGNSNVGNYNKGNSNNGNDNESPKTN